jgi:hypothetical protein
VRRKFPGVARERPCCSFATEGDDLAGRIHRMAPARRWADVLDLPPRLIKPGPGVAARLGLRAASRAAGAAPPKRMTPPCEVDRVVALACTRRPCHGNYRRAERGQGKSGLCCCYGILPLRRRFGSAAPALPPAIPPSPAAESVPSRKTTAGLSLWCYQIPVL